MDALSTILTIIMACGIPTAITGLVVRRLEKRIDERDQRLLKTKETREQAQKDGTVLLIQGVSAAISLGEATAHALQNGKPNGDMEEALKYAKKIKQAQKDFLAKQAAESMK